jgi:hypothetical protein
MLSIEGRLPKQRPLVSGAQNKRTVRANQQLVNDHKSSIGCRCGERDPVVLDLHHRRGTIKTETVSLLVQRAPYAIVRAEIAKCDVLCSNCHRRTHHQERRSRAKHEQLNLIGDQS